MLGRKALRRTVKEFNLTQRYAYYNIDLPSRCFTSFLLVNDIKNGQVICNEIPLNGFRLTIWKEIFAVRVVVEI